MYNSKAMENICCWLGCQAPHMCVMLGDAFRSAEENGGIGGLHKQAGKMTPGC